MTGGAQRPFSPDYPQPLLIGPVKRKIGLFAIGHGAGSVCFRRCLLTDAHSEMIAESLLAPPLQERPFSKHQPATGLSLLLVHASKLWI